MYVLEELWSGSIHPSERCFRERSQYATLMHECSELETVFYNELSADGKKAYKAHYENQMKLFCISEQDTYIRGVRLGAQFILDVLGEYHSPLPQVEEEET